jgi:hypothetical protein
MMDMTETKMITTTRRDILSDTNSTSFSAAPLSGAFSFFHRH